MNTVRNKKIAFIIPSLNSGGAERVTSILANYLSKDFDILIITFSSNNYLGYKLNSNISFLNCSLKNSNSANFLSAINNNLKIIKSIQSVLSKHKVDLVVSLTTTANILALISCKKLKTPCIISERANPYVYKPNRFWTVLRKIYYPKASYLVVQTSFIKDFYSKLFKSLTIKIIANPISGDLLLKKTNSINKEQIILNVGRLDKNKSQDLLIRAFANIDYGDWSLVFVGEGNQKDNYVQLAKDLNINEKVKFIGKSNKVEDYYNTSKIFAFTSQSEGFPNALLEAMYFELACISTNCKTGPSELISQNENGVLIPVDNQKELERELELLLSNSKLQKEYGRKAHESVLKYKPEIICKEWLGLIKNIIE